MTRDWRRVEVAPERLVGWVERFAERHGELTVRSAGDALTGREPEGALTITAPDDAVATMTSPWSFPAATTSERLPPPAPTSRQRLTRADADTALLERFVADATSPRTVGLLLVRRGGYAVGVAEGVTLVQSKVGSRYVQGRTKAGGWSQQRYARRRQAQAHAAFSAAADTAARILLPRVSELGGLVTGGDRAAVRSVLADPRLPRLGDLPTGRFLAVPDPRQRVLEDAVRRSRAVTIDVYDPAYG